jgi:hypothetical protein
MHKINNKQNNNHNQSKNNSAQNDKYDPQDYFKRLFCFKLNELVENSLKWKEYSDLNKPVIDLEKTIVGWWVVVIEIRVFTPHEFVKPFHNIATKNSFLFLLSLSTQHNTTQ